jgi:hypothetical protein
MKTSKSFEPDRVRLLTELEAENARFREMAANLTASIQSLQAAQAALGGTSGARSGDPAKNSAH